MGRLREQSLADRTRALQERVESAARRVRERLEGAAQDRGADSGASCSVSWATRWESGIDRAARACVPGTQSCAGPWRDWTCGTASASAAEAPVPASRSRCLAMTLRSRGTAATAASPPIKAAPAECLGQLAGFGKTRCGGEHAALPAGRARQSLAGSGDLPLLFVPVVGGATIYSGD